MAEHFTYRHNPPSLVQAGDRLVLQEVTLEAGSVLPQNWAAEASVTQALNIRSIDALRPFRIGPEIHALHWPCQACHQPLAFSRTLNGLSDRRASKVLPF